MIFVTVGTHEQQFNRLIEFMDQWADSHGEEVFIQTGFSTYEPKNCAWAKLIPFQEMNQRINDARIIITHGGPSSFIAPLQIGKTPVVVPRRKEYGEHVNNHQVDFCNAVAERQGNIIVVNEIESLADVLERYDEIVAGMPACMKSNNEYFVSQLAKIIQELVQ